MPQIQVTNIVVKKFRIICTVSLGAQKHSNEKIREALLKEMPTLAAHKCKNSYGKNFSEALASTSLAHVLEHMIIDIQSKHTSVALFGTTEWINEDAGIAKIELTYTDDLICLAAIKEAVNLLNEINQRI